MVDKPVPGAGMEPSLFRTQVPLARAGPLTGYAAVLFVAAVAVGTIPVAGLAVTDLPVAVWVLAALAVLADARPLMPRARRETVAASPSMYLIFAVLLGWGLGAALVLQAAAVGVAWWRARSPWWRAASALGQYAVALGVADLVLRGVGLRPYPSDGALALAGAGGVVLAAGALLAVSGVLVAVGLRLRFGTQWWAVSGGRLGRETLTYGLLLLLSPVVVPAAGVSAALMPLAAAPLYVVHQVARLGDEQRVRNRLDPLTGLGNRSALVAAVTDRLSGQHRSDHGDEDRFALLLLDLDRFKNVNNALGHWVGDRLLVEVGRRLSAAVPRAGEVIRMGGDEFAVVAPEVSGIADARATAGRIVAGLVEPVRLSGLPLEVSGSIGVAVFPDHGRDTATLMRHAEVAMYDAKRRNAPVAVYASGSDHDSIQRLELLADLRSALDSPDGGGMEMHYQPQIAVATGEVVGMEALLRWQHPSHGPVPPEEVIKVAEHTGVMRRLTLHVLDEVAEQVAKWSSNGVPLRASVNISVRDLHTGEVAERIAGLLRRYDLPPSRLQLEITEGALMADPQRVLATIGALDRLGVAVSLDDFGTGYSSLQHLRRLPLAEVKVDRSFVFGMADDPGDAAIVTSIVDLAGSLGLRVVAEGVEDERTWRLLANAGCQVAQGWFYAPPMPADELIAWYARYRPLPAQVADPAEA